MPDQQIHPQPPPAQIVSEPEVEPKPRSDAPPSANGEAPHVEPNYRYWREHGGEWVEGYDERKKRQVLYHIQELMLTHYMLQHAASAPSRPMKVLEFGCGVGRHLRNLTRLPDVDAHGYDQSPTMAAGILRWAGRQWFDSHIKVGMPTGTLPYPDKHFDIVYTAEVLVHVRPEHLDGILSQLIRVCRGHILHIETSEHIPLVSNSHDGCWRHDLVAAYARLGLECQVLPSGYTAHTPYRVKLAEEPRFTWPPAILEMYRRLERDINDGFEAQHAGALQQQETLRHQGELLRSEVARLTAALGETHAQLQAAQAAMAQLTQSVESQSARADALEGQLRKEQSEHAQSAALAGKLDNDVSALRQQLASLIERAADLEQRLAAEQARAWSLARERRTFMTEVSRYLRK